MSLQKRYRAIALTTACAALPVGALAADESMMSAAGDATSAQAASLSQSDGLPSAAIQPPAVEHAVMEMSAQRAAAQEAAALKNAAAALNAPHAVPANEPDAAAESAAPPANAPLVTPPPNRGDFVRDAITTSASGPVLESPFAGATAPARGEKKADADAPELLPLPDEADMDPTTVSTEGKTPRADLRNALTTGKRPQTPIKSQTIVDAQRWKQVDEQDISESAKVVGRVTLVNLNPNVNSWFLLSVRYTDGRRNDRMHLENADAHGQAVTLSNTGKALALVFTGANGQASSCDILSKDFQGDVKKAREAHNAFAPICDGRIYLRSKIDGRKTTKEWVVEFLRENVWGGETITSFVKEKFFKDKFLISADAENGSDAAVRHKNDASGPRNAQIDAKYESQALDPAQLSISVKKEDDNKMLVGRWYENPVNRGVFVSAIIPDKIDAGILKSYPTIISKLDAVEASSVDYVVGFDMARFDIGFAVGTDHPQVDWSGRALSDVVDNSVPGPDGFGSWEPLVTTGMVNPNLTKTIAAVFTGGFKRDHGAFKWGALAGVNHASHYGFVESGVVFSKLNPGLSTIAVFKDGHIEMKTWTEADDERVKDVAFARQNGVALIETDLLTGLAKPGDQVKNWGAGNWSGSEDSKFRTLRAGLCLQENAGKKFLIYGYFSSVTPSAMARVFQAYNCSYAMHLDMNALEHTYLSVFPSDGRNVTYEHLISGMKAVDKSFADKTIPRFIGFPDNRDFFYLWRKDKE